VNGTPHYDLAVVGAGIVGLAHAVAALRRRRSVVVVERSAAITGATVRNFGHIAPSVQAGEARELAERSRELWLRLAGRAGFWLRESGTLVAARAEDELAVLEEAGEGVLLSGAEIAGRAPLRGAVGGAFLPRDLQLDPREAGPALARFLADSGVAFRWRTSALGAEPGLLHTTRGSLRAEAIVIAVNADVDQLFPRTAERHGVERCRLDMLLTEGVGLGAPLLTGTSLLRYGAFAAQPSAGAVRARLAAQAPELLQRDVNEMYAERPDGSLVLGDTHAVDAAAPPFQEEAAFALLLRLGESAFGRPLAVRERWQGVYATAAQDFLRTPIADGVQLVSVTTGTGMTTGLGLGESVIEKLWGVST